MKTSAFIAALFGGLLFISAGPWGEARAASVVLGATVTNLLQLVQIVHSNEAVLGDVQLEATVCAASRPALGAVILQDETDAELLEFSGGVAELVPGERIRIDQKNCLLRRTRMGVQISAAPIVDNDGIHPFAYSRTKANVQLKQGAHSFTLEWFNRIHVPGLEVEWAMPGPQPVYVPFTNGLYSRSEDGGTGGASRHPGLSVECYEGEWERVPNFDLLTPVKSGNAAKVDLDLRTRDEWAGMRFRGWFDAPTNGIYSFATRSADGSLLFIDDVSVPVEVVGKDAVPEPVRLAIDGPLAEVTRQQWMTVEGRVGSVVADGHSLELELFSERNSLLVRIADAKGLKATNLLNSLIRVTGLGCGLFNLQGEVGLGRMFVANAEGVETIRLSNIKKQDGLPLVKAEQVQALALDDAKRQMPVHLRGVVTSKGRPQDSWISIQDDTRGIFVKEHNASNVVPSCGDFYEVIGKSGAGDFAPVVYADQLIRLGTGEMPQPIRPTWDELNNGSMDVQWVEFKGLVTDVHSNTLSMLLPSGPIDVQVEGVALFSLKSFDKAVVRIRGVLFAVWNAARELRVGSILMRNADIKVEIPPPVDPLNAVLKTPRELLLFDAQSAIFRRVKVQGQIIYSDSRLAFLQEGNEGLRLLAARETDWKPGDLVDAVGYPSISKSSLFLRETMIRKTGEANLPPPKKLTESLSGLEYLDSTRVRVEGQLLGWHFEQGMAVLEMQWGKNLYLARLSRISRFRLQVGSQLALVGVFVSQGRPLHAETGANLFELFLNSPDDIVVLSQPSWWTLERLLVLVGILVTILVFSMVWIRQLRRLIEQRTAQLQREMHERELAERQRALEVERSRIARDLHDDLGASLTEIAVLAGKGHRTPLLEKGVSELFYVITAKARELVAALDIIVWAVDPKDNTLQSVADYLCDFTDEYLSPSGIVCRFDVPVTLPPVVLEGRVRHDLFLSVKETLNNIVRHARATEVAFEIAVVNGQLEIQVIDNGKGFEIAAASGGKGRKSVPLRLSKIGGSYEVVSMPGRGTTVKITLRLPAEKPAGMPEGLRYDD